MFQICRTSRSLILNNVRFQHRKPSLARPAADKDSTGMKWALLSIPIASFGLGCWQVRRREWKLNLLKNLEEKTSNEPVDLPADLWELNTLEYCPVRVKGKFLHDREILIGPRSRIKNGGLENSGGSIISNSNETQGWVVVTPFQLSNRQEIILINRGWVPNDIKNPSKRAEGQVTHEIDLTGTVRFSENRPQFMPKNMPEKGVWFYKDLDQMAKLAGTAPILLDAKGPDKMPKGWPIPNQTKITHRNEHLNYLITWFSLSAITSFLWVRRFVYNLR